MKHWAVAWAVALALPAAMPSAAAPFAVRLGLEKIVFDAPPGFSDTGDLASPRLQELSESLTSASNRILVFALTDADRRRFMNGDPIDAKRYMVAATPRGVERDSMTGEQFAALVAESLRDIGKPPGAVDYLKYLDKQPHGKPSLLLDLKKEPALVSVLQGTRIPMPPSGGLFSEEKPPQYLFSTNTLLLIRGKALHLSIYASYEGPADVAWLKSITERWVSDLQRLNSRP